MKTTMKTIIQTLTDSNFEKIDGRSNSDCGFYISFVDSAHFVLSVRYPHSDYLQTKVGHYVGSLKEAGFIIDGTAIFNGMGKIALAR